MPYTRIIVLSILFIQLLFGCSESEKPKDIVAPQKENHGEKSEKTSNTEEFDYSMIDKEIAPYVIKLDSQFACVPLFIKLNDKFFFISSSVENKNQAYALFENGNKFGLVDANGKILVENKYDKIHNPNQALISCFEITQDGFVGLYNYETSEFLIPQFEFILPEDKISTIAYGLKKGKWYKIDAQDLNQFKEVEFNPIKTIANLSFDATSLGNNYFRQSYYTYYEGDPIEADNIVIPASYYSYFGITFRDYYSDVITPEELDKSDFGTPVSKSEMEAPKELKDKVYAFFSSLYEEGIDGRGYVANAKELVIYNQRKNTFSHQRLFEKYDYPQICGDPEFIIIGDSLVEVSRVLASYDDDELLYSLERIREYFKISKTGDISKLESHRHFDYTKYIVIDERHFEGCFAQYIPEEQIKDGNNICTTEHLSINDLDIMRNEIYAEYGLIFKTKQWQDYFGTKDWYKPKFENVDHLLTEIDKANIKTILAVKEKMLGKEGQFLNKKISQYYEAG